MSGACRVDNQALCVPDIGHMCPKLQAIDQLGSSLSSASDSKYSHCSGSFWQVVICPFFVRVAFMAWIKHPINSWMRLQIFHYLFGIGNMLLHSYMKSFKAQCELECTLCTHCRP